MRISLFYNLPSGGAKRALYEWIRRLAKKHLIDVYTLSTADHAFCDLRPYVRAYRIIEFKPHKLFHSPIGRLNQLQRWRDLGDLTAIGERVAEEINTGGYDIVFVHSCLFSTIPAILQFLEIPAVYYLHEPFGRLFSRQIQRPYQNNNKWRRTLDHLDPLIKLYESRLAAHQYNSMQKTDLLLANSIFTQERIQTAFGVNASVCHYGVDGDTFHPIPGTRQGESVISVGELTPRKGFDFVVESLGHIPYPDRPKLTLACNMVDSYERAYIQELSAQNGVSLRVMTNLNAGELVVEYNRARLCVYAPVLEPFGLVPLESMSCGTPVVGVQEGGVPESIVHEHTGLLVERDPAKFAGAVQRLLSNPGLVLEYGRNGREHILKNWTWDQSVATLERHLAVCANVN